MSKRCFVTKQTFLSGNQFVEHHSWCEPAWKKLKASQQEDRVHHGLILVAPEGYAGNNFASFWAQEILCSTGDACGHCKSCHLLQTGTHPDFYRIGVLEDKKKISIDQIRDFTGAIHEKAHLSGWRIAIIEAADSLSENGFNALLKTLEEPGEKTLIMLITSKVSALSATIKSRCQMIHLDDFREESLKNWLSKQTNNNFSDEAINMAIRVSHSAPLLAFSSLENSESTEFDQFLDLLSVLSSNGLLSQYVQSSSESALKVLNQWLAVTDWVIALSITASFTENEPKALVKLAQAANVRLLFKFRDSLLFLLKELQTGVSLSLPMQLDQLSAHWAHCFSD